MCWSKPGLASLTPRRKKHRSTYPAPPDQNTMTPCKQFDFKQKWWDFFTSTPFPVPPKEYNGRFPFAQEKMEWIEYQHHWRFIRFSKNTFRKVNVFKACLKAPSVLEEFILRENSGPVDVDSARVHVWMSFFGRFVGENLCWCCCKFYGKSESFGAWILQDSLQTTFTTDYSLYINPHLCTNCTPVSDLSSDYWFVGSCTCNKPKNYSKSSS